MEHETKEGIPAVETKLESLTKNDLLQTTRALKVAHDNLVGQAEALREENKHAYEYAEKMRAEAENIAHTAEDVIYELNLFHSRREQAVFSILDNIKVLFEEPSFNKKGNKGE